MNSDARHVYSLLRTPEKKRPPVLLLFVGRSPAAIALTLARSCVMICATRRAVSTLPRTLMRCAAKRRCGLACSVSDSPIGAAHRPGRQVDEVAVADLDRDLARQAERSATTHLRLGRRPALADLARLLHVGVPLDVAPLGVRDVEHVDGLHLLPGEPSEAARGRTLMSRLRDETPSADGFSRMLEINAMTRASQRRQYAAEADLARLEAILAEVSRRRRASFRTSAMRGSLSAASAARRASASACDLSVPASCELDGTGAGAGGAIFADVRGRYVRCDARTDSERGAPHSAPLCPRPRKNECTA